LKDWLSEDNSAEILPLFLRYNVAVRTTPLNISTVKPCVVRGQRFEMMYLGRRSMPVKQTVIWALARVAHRVLTKVEGQRLTLTVIDHQGRELHAGSRMITLRLVNEDIKELTLPEDSVCSGARQWLEKIGERLLLRIEDFRPNEPLPSKMANLYAGVDPAEKQAYGILLLGRGL